MATSFKLPTGGNALRVLRAAHGYNQITVAAHLGCGINRYWRIENGHATPSKYERRKLAELFGVPLSAIPSEAA